MQRFRKLFLALLIAPVFGLNSYADDLVQSHHKSAVDFAVAMSASNILDTLAVTERYDCALLYSMSSEISFELEDFTGALETLKRSQVFSASALKDIKTGEEIDLTFSLAVLAAEDEEAYFALVKPIHEKCDTHFDKASQLALTVSLAAVGTK